MGHLGLSRRQQMKMRIATVAVATFSLLALSACGTTTEDRALSGGAIGLGAGAVAGAILGGPVIGAALLGGAVGAATGAITRPSNVDLGKPVWKGNEQQSRQ
jgi:osmotically inducible lipoprotein OsmB